MTIDDVMRQQYRVEEYPAERKMKLDELFNAFSIVAEGTYVYLCDMKYDISRWSKAAVDAFGLPGDYMFDAGDIWEERIHPEDRDVYHRGIEDIFSGNENGHDMQYRALKITGEYDVCTCRGVVILDNDNTPNYFAGVIRNHGEQGHVDTLTGIRNQYGFFEDLQSNLNRHQSMKVFMIGINKFTEVNEVYGYHFGNRVLQECARFIYDIVGNDGSVYRIDGAKFAVITGVASVEKITQSYETARNYFRSRFVVDGVELVLELNAALLQVPNFDIDTTTIFTCLNFAYTESKTRRQGDLVEFYNDLNDQKRSRLEKLNAIRASIPHGYSGFFLLYQPVVDAKTEHLIGGEALLRWKNDEYGVVPPDHFISLLEADPLFPQLGEWILRQAINAGKQIMERYPDFVINVNLSYTQLEKPDFCDMVFSVLNETGYPAEHLCLEITERCRLLDINMLKNSLVCLKSRGVKIALDDFGTGFSSVGLIKTLPFDIIKIDRTFVQQIEKDDMERELIQHFSGLASTFGAKVCVEGVETDGMRDILQKFHVQSFQGYFYAKPLPLDEFLRWKES